MRTLKIYPDSALFLDRDGVLTRIDDSHGPEPEIGLPLVEGALETMALVSPLFCRVFVVTNQQAVRAGRLEKDLLEARHGWLKERVRETGGRIDEIYSSICLRSEGSFMHKPGVGMGLKARRDYPGFSFRNSFMVGDRRSDMEFGKRLGMVTILIGRDPVALCPPMVADWRLDSVKELPRLFLE